MRLELGRLRIVADGQPHAHRLEVARAAMSFFSGVGPSCTRNSAGCLPPRDEVGAADVGRQHRLLDQPVRLVAHARHDLLDAAVLVADDLRLGGLEVDRAALVARLEQRAVDVVQVQQVRHAVLAPRAPRGRACWPRIAATSV